MTALSRSPLFARFIPSEEIGDVAQWRFGVVGEPMQVVPEALPMPEVEPEPEEPEQVKLGRAWDEGYTAGFAQGQAEATQEGHRQLDAYVQNQGAEAAQRLSALTDALDARLKQAEQDIAQQVLALACGLARQVVRRELSADPNALLPVVREALGMLVMDGKTTVVKLHPQDLELLQQPLREEFPAASVHWLADAAVAPGDCLVESGGTVIDGSVAKRWERAVAQLGLADPWQEAGHGAEPDGEHDGD